MPAITITCHCSKQFDLPERLEGRRVNCPVCNSVIFLTADQLAGAGYDEDEEEDDSDEGYGFAAEPEAAEEKRRPRGVTGVPDWLSQYRRSPALKKGEWEKTLALLEKLGGVNPTLDPMGATLHLAATHSDAETSVAALVTVAMSGHPSYGPLSLTLLGHVGPSDAAGAQQLLIMLNEAKTSQAQQLIKRVLWMLGPTPLVHVRSLIEVLGSRHGEIIAWAVQCLGLIGPPAKKSVETLLKLLSVADDDLRMILIDALTAIERDGQHVLPLLFDALRHQTPEYRAHAAQALGRLGVSAARAVPLLQEVQNDIDPEVRQAASTALLTIMAAIEATRGTSNAPTEPAEEQPPEPIHLVCSCGKRLRAKPELAGKKVKCPNCSGVVTIPFPEPRPAPVFAAPPVNDPVPPVAEKECLICQATVPETSALCVFCGHDFR